MAANGQCHVRQGDTAVEHAEVDGRRQQVGDVETEPDGLAHW